MDIVALGLWLAGVGALGAIADVLMQPPSTGSGGRTFASPEAARPERIRHAVRLVSAALVAIGSALFAVASLPAWWVVPATAAVVLTVVWLICAWSQHRVWSYKRAEATRMSVEDRQRYPKMEEKYACAHYCGRWSWALRHPFNGKTWPDDFKKAREHERTRRTTRSRS